MNGTGPRSGPAAAGVLVAVCALFAATATGSAVADELNGYIEFTGTRTDTRLTGPFGFSTDTTSRSFLQRYSLDFEKSIVPTISFQIGGLFEKQNSRFFIEESGTDLTATKLRPYAALRFRSLLTLAEITFDRNEERVHPDSGPTTGLVRDRYAAAFGWYPVALPTLRLGFQHTNTYDTPTVFLDRSETLYQLNSEYYPIESLRLYYNGSASETVDNINHNDLEGLTHAARVTYTGDVAKDRVSIYSDYSVNYSKSTLTTSGQGDVIFLVPPFGGLSAIDDTPGDSTLNANPALIDDNLTVGAGVDLGLPPPGGDTKPRNIGIDLAQPTEVNTLYLWVDRDLRADVAASFTWQIWASGDNLNWRLLQTVAPAAFGPFLTRFEIPFNNVTARYVKLVVKPLEPSVPFASDYPNILVTEIQALIRKPVKDAVGTTSGTTQIYTLDVRARLLKDFPLYYELSYFLTKAGQAPSLYTLSNGVSVSYPIEDIYTVTARLAREDGRELLGDRLAYIGSASMAVSAIPTLRQIVIFSGTDETVGVFTRDVRSVFLNNTATLYHGIDVGLNLGKSSSKDQSSLVVDTGTISAYATLVPNDRMTFNWTYTGESVDLSGGAYGSGSRYMQHNGEISLAYRPFPTLYLFGSYRVEYRTSANTQTINNFSVDWAPFPDGTLHFNFAYNQTLRPEADITETIITPSLRWDITRRAYLNLSYQKLVTDDPLLATNSDILSADFRVSF